MTRTKLRELLSQKTHKYVERLNHCSARISKPKVVKMDGEKKIAYFLKSYQTPVAMGVIDADGVKVYTDDYYSATTCQHVHKFARRLCKEFGWPEFSYQAHKLYTHSKMRKAERELALATDFAC